MNRFFDKVQEITERKLTQRKAYKETMKARRTVKSEVLDWLDALAFAVIFVFLLNQYIFQMFVIPSPSMEDTLLVGDRVLVNKMIYGLEVFPEGPKIFVNRTPDRDDIITFYNPRYESKGPVYSVLSQMLYMATMSLVNIDVDSEGNPNEKLYVKRAAGLSGDVVCFENGDVMIRPAGLDEYEQESLYRSQNGLSSSPSRTLDPSIYQAINAWGRLLAYQDAGLSDLAPAKLKFDYQNLDSSVSAYDYYQISKAKALEMSYIDPSNMESRSEAAKYRIGIYVPEGYILPLGDNRDNSGDGRYFGPVSTADVNGRVVFTVWPFTRMRQLLSNT